MYFDSNALAIGSVLWGSVVSSDIWTLARREGGRGSCLLGGRPPGIFIAVEISNITNIIINTNNNINFCISIKINVNSNLYRNI